MTFSVDVAYFVRISVGLAGLLTALGGAVLLVLGLMSSSRVDRLYDAVVGRRTSRLVDESVGVLSHHYAVVPWVPQARRLVVRRRARSGLSIIFVFVVTALLLLPLFLAFGSRVARSETTPLTSGQALYLLVVLAVYFAALTVSTVWDATLHSDEGLVLSSLYLLRHVDERSEEVGLQRSSGVLGQLQMVSRCVDQFEYQVSSKSAFNLENSFTQGMDTLRYLVGKASEAIITGHPSSSSRLAVVAYRCAEVAVTGRVTLVLDVPPPPKRFDADGQRRSLTFFVAVVVIAFAGVAYFLLSGEILSRLGTIIGALAVLVPAALRLWGAYRRQRQRS